LAFAAAVAAASLGTATPASAQDKTAPAPLPAPTPVPMPAPATVPAPFVGSDGVEMGTIYGGADFAPSSSRIVLQADYLHWWVRGVSIPAIINTGDPNNIRGGAVGEPGTRTLFGNNLNYDDMNGARFGLLLEGDCFSWDVSYFYLTPKSIRFSAASNAAGVPVLAVPFNDTDPAAPGEKIFAIANGVVPFPGAVNIESKLELWGVETNTYYNWRRNDERRTDLLFGFRYVDLKNTFIIDAQSNNPAANLSINDTFVTRNEFYGLQFGGKTHQNLWRNLNLDVAAKLALGVMHQEIDIHGQTASPGFTPDAVGFFAQTGNSGRSSHDDFAAVPQVQVRLSYDMCTWFRVYGGYEFLYLSSVALAGEQIDRNINSSFIPGFGPSNGFNSPVRNDRRTDFMAHGLTFGFELSF
jgi:hypothetical protein